jgi:hypothetical protein
MKITHKKIGLIALGLGIFLSTFVLYTPAPNTDDDSYFNTVEALNTIAAISQDQHSVFDEENHEEVRLYLKDRLVDYLGEDNVSEYDYSKNLLDTEEEIEYDIHNLFGVIPGNSDTAILIVGHYDSRGQIGRSGELGESYGAADDGYAIATILEIARLYADKDLENTIYLLMTDAEETGLYGAQMAATETDIMDNVGFVINIEARGVKGPAYMFETSTDNNKVIDFYNNANLPVSYSLATAVYTVMPNSTDFTEFLAIDLNGINFAVLDSLYYYHTPRDNYDNVSPSSIQHYGEQILPLVDEFVMNSEYSDVNYFDGSHDQVFFTVFPNVFIHYSEQLANVLHIFSFLILIGFIAYSFIKKWTSIKGLGIASLLFGTMMFTAIIVGNIVGRIVAFYSKVPFNITYVKTNIGGLPTLITLVGLSLVFYYFYQKKWTKYKNEFLIVGSSFNLLLAILTGLVLSGASFLFFVIGLVGLISLWISINKRTFISQTIYSILLILSMLVLLPILYSLYLALTVGGLLALGLILSFYLIILIPMFHTQISL